MFFFFFSRVKSGDESLNRSALAFPYFEKAQFSQGTYSFNPSLAAEGRNAWPYFA